MQRNVHKIAGVDLEVFEVGAGAPLIMLHGANGFDPNSRVNSFLSERRRLICPSHPGFGKSSLPDWIDSIDDLAYIHLELMDRLELSEAELIGCSMGGWVAAEMAAMVPERFKKLVMVGPVGVKTGPSDRLDIPDIFALSQEQAAKLLFHDPAKMRVNPSELSDEQLAIMVRNRETLALLTWEPYMHNPKLRHRLHRVTAPALFIRGESDGLISPEYLQSYARLLPNARTVTIAAAGHAPQLEQPERFAEAVLAFLND